MNGENMAKGKHRASRRGTIRGRPVGEVDDVKLTGDELADEETRLRDFARRGLAAQLGIDDELRRHKNRRPEGRRGAGSLGAVLDNEESDDD